MLTQLPNDYSLASFDVVLGSLGAELDGGDVVRAEAVGKKKLPSQSRLSCGWIINTFNSYWVSTGKILYLSYIHKLRYIFPCHITVTFYK